VRAVARCVYVVASIPLATTVFGTNVDAYATVWVRVPQDAVALDPLANSVGGNAEPLRSLGYGETL
jgi:hypothetical protein